MTRGAIATQPMRSTVLVAAAYALVTIVMLALPLVNVLHAESCAVLAFAAFFLAGADSIARFRRRERLVTVLRTEVLLLLIPLGIYQIARIFVPGCELLAGLLYFAIFPVVSVVFGVALGYVLTARRADKAGPRFVTSGLTLALSTVIFDLGFHPQFYVYNHIFGGVLGPIYDLQLAIRPGLYVFRTMTIAWAVVLMLLGFRLRSPSRGRLATIALTALAAILGAAYSFGPQLGINTTHGMIAASLGSSIETEHFRIHYDADAIPEPEIGRIAQDHEFRYEMMENALGFSVGRPILSYIYPTAARRAQLTGAGRTDIAPVWLSRPQVHVLYESYDRTFAHELAHVFSRGMGLPILRASLRVGLVEGFAVAMEPPIGLPSATDQVAAIRNGADFDSLYSGQSLASAVAASLSPFGFWSGRGAVSYATMGSFVRYLLDTYGPEPFRQVYGMTSFESAYGVRLIDLAAGWEASLIGREFPPAVADLASSRFSVLSIFERHCPHDTPPAVSRYWEALDYLQIGDTSAARGAIDEALNSEPEFAPALTVWAKLELARGGAANVVARLEPFLSADSSLAVYLGLPLGDAYAIEGSEEEAKLWYARAESLQSPFARSSVAILRLRSRLVGSPAAISAANAVGGRDQARARLAESEGPDSKIVAALLAADAYDFETGFELLRGVIARVGADTVDQRVLAWAATFAYRAANFEEAERFRSLAVQAAHQTSDHYEILRLEDFGKRIGWSIKTESTF